MDRQKAGIAGAAMNGPHLCVATVGPRCTRKQNVILGLLQIVIIFDLEILAFKYILCQYSGFFFIVIQRVSDLLFPREVLLYIGFCHSWASKSVISHRVGAFSPLFHDFL